MLHFRMNMPFILMTIYGSMMILIILLLRALLKKRLPKFVFPILWCVILARLLVPFSISSPLTLKTSADSLLSVSDRLLNTDMQNIAVAEDTEPVEDTGTVSSEAAIENMTIRTTPASHKGTAKSSESAVPVTSDTISPGASRLLEAAAEDSESIVFSYDYAEGLSFPFALRGHALLFIYTAGLLLTAGILLYQKYHYSRKLKNSLLIEHNETVSALLREMNMGHILVFTNDEIASPLTCGLLAPHIYLPTRMDFRNRELLHHILLHETMHIKRRDNWVKTVMLAALILNWFNPLVWIMARYFAADLETACDEAVLRTYSGEEDRKNYAFNLLAMAITGSRTTLLYSAFSKTEVEKRIQSILSYKKTSAFLLLAAACFITCSTVAFATCAWVPFSPYLTNYCASDGSRWGVKVYTTRDLALGNDAQKRAEDIVFDVLDNDTGNDPLRMDEQMRTALSEAFHVEKSAFRTDFFLCLDDKELESEYAEWELTRDQNGFYHYKDEAVRIFIDEIGGVFQSHSEGTVDITVIRDSFGYISDVRIRHESMPVMQAP